jgi:DNA-binding NarL/FixJ family response regulator
VSTVSKRGGCESVDRQLGPMLHKFVRSTLETQRDLIVAREAVRGNEGLHLFKQPRPDVILTDIDLNGQQQP